MITLKQFVGALLEEITNGRAIGDLASTRIAEHYLQHDYLKGYPVPRLHIKDIEIELQFAVGSNLVTGSIFDDDEVQRNILNKVKHFLTALPDTDPFRESFDQEERDRWASGLQSQQQHIERILARQYIDKVSLIHALSLAVENLFYQVALDRPQSKLLAAIGDLFQGQRAQEERQFMRDSIRHHIRQIIDSVDTPAQEAEALDELVDLNILVTSSELEGLDPTKMQKIKLTFTSSDRKWVKTDKDGEEQYILDRH